MSFEILRFDGKVAIVTGAGAGLGRAYALLLGSLGAKVVVNDLGGSRSGDGCDSNVADNVVNEIRSQGGTAVADYNSVIDGDKVVQTALDSFGRIDIVINNAGILRDKSFARLSDSDWDLVHQVHLKGSFKVSQAAWPHMRKQKYGRIIMTSSNSGLYGNFGQANYSAAKMGLVGLCKTLAIEGRSSNILCNVIVPTAASRLTEDILPPDLYAELKPELIAPVVAWLCHEDCEESGAIIEAAAGWATKYALARGKGSMLRSHIKDTVTIERVKYCWDSVTDLKNPTHVSSIEEATASLMTSLDSIRQSGQVKVSEPPLYKLDFKTCIIYALGIGASTKNREEMKYLYENHHEFSAFPTMAILPGLMGVMSSSVVTDAIPNQSIGLHQILHGEQYIELLKPFPTSGEITSEFELLDTLDKGRNAVILLGVNSYDENGDKIAYGQITVFARSAGGFGGPRTTNKDIKCVEIPNRKPDAVVQEATSVDQAALYRMSGDLNPLHIDDEFSKMNGFDKPILHGLCSLGFSARHVVSKFGNGDPNSVKAIKARFTKPVTIGDSLKTAMWLDGNRVIFETTAVGTGQIAIEGFVDLRDVTTTTSSIRIMPKISSLKSDDIFDMIDARIKDQPELAKKVNGVFKYEILLNGATAATWIVDMKTNKVYREDKEKVNADATLKIEDEDFLKLVSGTLEPQVAFLKGKLKIQGNLMLAQKLAAIMKTNSKL